MPSKRQGSSHPTRKKRTISSFGTKKPRHVHLVRSRSFVFVKNSIISLGKRRLRSLPAKRIPANLILILCVFRRVLSLSLAFASSKKSVCFVFVFFHAKLEMCVCVPKVRFPSCSALRNLNENNKHLFQRQTHWLPFVLI